MIAVQVFLFFNQKMGGSCFEIQFWRWIVACFHYLLISRNALSYLQLYLH